MKSGLLHSSSYRPLMDNLFGVDFRREPRVS